MMTTRQGAVIIPFRSSVPVSAVDNAIADSAYHLWLEWGFRGGLPEDALLVAVHEAYLAQELRGTPHRGLFLVPKRSPAPNVKEA